MNARLVGFRWRPAHAGGERGARAALAGLGPDLAPLLCRRGVLLALDRCGEGALMLPDDLGVIVGPLFSGKEHAAPVTQIDKTEAWALAQSGGRRLIERYWGGYLAVLHDRERDELHLVREPCGAGPIYWFQLSAGVTAFCTRADDVVAIAPETVADETMIAAFLAQPRLTTRRTALAGVNEVLPGCRLTFSREARFEDVLWRPAVQGDDLDFDAGVAALRATASNVASAWVQYSRTLGEGPIAHRLSGGFDSAVVAAALHEAGARQVQCFNEYPADLPEGDERVFATSVAARWAYPLQVLEARPETVDYTRMLTCELTARPSHAQYSFSDNLLSDAISASGAMLITSGQGGDQVLHRSRTAAIAADAVFDGRPACDAWRIILDTARLVRSPAWGVLGEVAANVLKLKRFSPYNSGFDNPFALESASATAMAEWVLHPWMQDMRKATPARALRMAHIADLQFYHERSSLSGHFVSAPILTSQPIVECALAIAPYIMTRGGKERALARAAFDAWIPREVAMRRHKGDTTRYHLKVLERQIGFVRESLLEGELVKRGLLHRTLLEETLRRDFIVDARAKAGIMTAFVAEMWLKRLAKTKDGVRESV